MEWVHYETAVRKDVLSKMLVRRQITTAQYMAGRLWQHYRDHIQIQPPRGCEWDTPIWAQKLYQSRSGAPSDRQCFALSMRKILRDELGRAAFDHLDRLLSLPDRPAVRLNDAAVAYFGALLMDVSILLDIQAGGLDYGAEREPRVGKRNPTAVLRREQPWLFDPIRTQGKPSANKIRGRWLNAAWVVGQFECGGDVHVSFRYGRLCDRKGTPSGYRAGTSTKADSRL